MKKILIVICLVSSVICNAQIEILPENQTVVVPKEARVRSVSKPFWIGVGSPLIHLDSSDNKKMGIGSSYLTTNTTFGQTKFFEHAKVHIRHEGGPGSEFQAQKGPHLLLDEATADKAATIRFRQSIVEPEGAFSVNNKLTLGARYWDLRGFANGASLASDEFRLINSGASEDLLTIDGDGNFKFSGEGSTRLEIKGPDANQPVKLEFGEVGTASNGGRIWYNTNTDVMQVFSDGAASLTIDNGRVGIGSVNPGTSKLYVDGYSTLGDHAQAPKIKTWYGEAFLPSSYNGVTNHNILPVVGNRIISCSVLVTNDNGLVIPPNMFEESFDSYYYYTISGTTISFYTDDSIDVSSQDVLGKLARIFITYTE